MVPHLQFPQTVKLRIRYSSVHNLFLDLNLHIHTKNRFFFIFMTEITAYLYAITLIMNILNHLLYTFPYNMHHLLCIFIVGVLMKESCCSAVGY